MRRTNPNNVLEIFSQTTKETNHKNHKMGRILMKMANCQNKKVMITMKKKKWLQMKLSIKRAQKSDQQ